MELTVGELVLAIALCSAALTLWVLARFPGFGPMSLTSAVGNVIIALVAGPLIMGPVLGFVGHLAVPGSTELAILAGAMAPTVYLFIAIAWLVRSFQRLFGAFI